LRNFEGTGDMDITADNTALVTNSNSISTLLLLTFFDRLQVLVNFSSSYQYSFQNKTQLLHDSSKYASRFDPYQRYKYFALTGLAKYSRFRLNQQTVVYMLFLIKADCLQLIQQVVL
jgi:hypothetical protein